MGTLKEEASNYQAPSLLNIADLEKIPLDLAVEDRDGMDKDNKPFKYKVAILNGNEYRVPNPVLEQIQMIVKLKPECKFIAVSKTGSGVATRYNVEAI